MNQVGRGSGRARAATAVGEPSGLRLPALPVLAWSPHWFAERLDAERERLFLWVPVLFATGIAAYFGLPREPSLVAVWLLAAGLGIVWWRVARAGNLAIGWGAAFAASLGLAVATARTAIVAAPVVPAGEWHATVEGRIEAVDLNEDGSVRLAVAPTAIAARGPPFAPPRRLSLWMRYKDVALRPGDHVAFTAILLPPPDAAVPGGFDYARQAFFEAIGGVGYLISRPRHVPESRAPDIRARLSIAASALRDDLAARIMAAVPGRAGAIAAALVTGKRGAIPKADQEALRVSGLAHILAISGLHMMLVVGTLFWSVRTLLAISPSLALNRPIKKWAAATAFVGGAAYLVLSGASIATQRAFVMAAVMLLSVLIDRPAITLRNVALAALLVLVMTPEALTGASFQMSFAATVALVATYETVRQHWQSSGDPVHPAVRFVGRAVFGLALTSLIAGLATAPFGAFHFNRVAVYGLAANLAAMPVVSLLVMPMGLASCLLMPFGLETFPLAAMGFGIDIVLAIAHGVASWPGAVRMVPQMPLAALGLMTVGGLWLALWRTGWRLWGLPALALGGAIALQTAPPDVYINRSGTLVALRTDTGELAFVPRRSTGYEAESWRRHAGIDPTLQAREVLEAPVGAAAESASPSSTAALATGMAGTLTGPAAAIQCDPIGCIASRPGLTLALVRDPAAFSEDCIRADVVVSPFVPPDSCAATALVVGPQQLAVGGATIIRRSGPALLVSTAAERAGIRPWSRRTTEAADTRRITPRSGNGSVNTGE